MGEITIDAAVFNGLLEKIHTLENAVMCDKMCDKKSKPTLAGLVKVKPLSHPAPLEQGEPVFGYRDYPNYDAWNHFRELARCLLTESPLFYMSTTNPGSRTPYIRSTGADKPKDLRKLPEEDLELAAKMLDEMIVIYNRYFVETHRTVLYKPDLYCEAVHVKAFDPPKRYVETDG